MDTRIMTEQTAHPSLHRQKSQVEQIRKKYHCFHQLSTDIFVVFTFNTVAMKDAIYYYM